MKNKTLTALLVTAAVMVAACGSQPVIPRTAASTPSPAGIITEFPIPTANSSPGGITAGPDGNLWFTECVSSSSGCTKSQIGRITPTGTITEIPLPTDNSGPNEVVTGPDGNLWFTEGGANKIGRITSGK